MQISLTSKTIVLFVWCRWCLLLIWYYFIVARECAAKSIGPEYKTNSTAILF